MATEFYKRIPESIKGKLEEYRAKYSYVPHIPLSERADLIDCFAVTLSPEGEDFWYKHHTNKTFPQWSDELNRFIDPPQVNTITVNADEYQAMREFVINNFKGQYEFYRMHKSKESHNIMAYCLKQMGIDINEIIN